MNKLWKPALLLATVAVMAIGMLNSGAWFTDGATSTTGSLSSGTLSIDDGKLSTVPLGTFTNMAPGDKTGYAEIIIQNNGTIPLAWFGNLVLSDSVLKDAIYIDYAKMEFLKPGGTESWYPPDGFFLDGEYTYEDVAPLTGDDDFVSLAEWDGNNGMGVSPYEFMGYLEPGFMYKLTLRLGFLEAAGNGYQGAGPLDLSFEVDATQVKQGALDALGVGNAYPWLNLWPACQLTGDCPTN